MLAFRFSDGLGTFEGVQKPEDEPDQSETQSIFDNIAEVERLMASLAPLDETQGSYAAQAQQEAAIVTELELIAVFLQ